MKRNLTETLAIGLPLSVMLASPVAPPQGETRVKSSVKEMCASKSAHSVFDRAELDSLSMGDLYGICKKEDCGGPRRFNGQAIIEEVLTAKLLGIHSRIWG